MADSITFYQGEDRTWPLTWEDSSGALIDWSAGWTTTANFVRGGTSVAATTAVDSSTHTNLNVSISATSSANMVEGAWRLAVLVVKAGVHREFSVEAEVLPA